MADPTEPHFKVVYNKLGQVVDVEPLEGGTVKYKKQPMKENPLSGVASMTDTHIFMGGQEEKDGNCQWIHNGCNLWYICW